MFFLSFQMQHRSYNSGPAEQGGGGGDRPPNISRILPIFPKISPENLTIRGILRLSPPQYLHRPLNDLESAPALHFVKL